VKKTHRSRGLTLVELMATLMIFAVVSAAAMSMLMSSANTQRYVLKSVNSSSQVELAFRRIVENLRSASQATCLGTTELDLVTQADTSKTGNPVYNVSYALVGSQLIENDDRYGSNVLAANVTSFSITPVQTTKPTMFRVVLTITPDSGGPVTRQSYVTSRNF
jgi:prepilin-type N-terminal cleavage/methylation domain-containing protein